MNVTLLYADDCPHWRQTDQHLRTLAQEIPGLVIHRHVVHTNEDANQIGFRGSPSVIVDGVDPFANGDAPLGLSCRLYQTSKGLSGSPDLDQLRTVLTEA